MEIFPYSVNPNNLPETVLVIDSSLNPEHVVYLHRSVLEWLYTKDILQNQNNLQSQKLYLEKSDSSLEHYDQWSTICETAYTQTAYTQTAYTLDNKPLTPIKFNGYEGLVTHELIDGKMSFVCRLG